MRVRVVFKVVREEDAVESSFPNQILHFEVAGVEFADRERNTAKAARRDDRGNTAAIGQARIEDRLRLGDIVAEPPSDILYGYHEGLFAYGHARHLLQEALFFDEHPVGTVHHHLADRVVEDEVFDGLQERQDHFKSVQFPSPRIVFSSVITKDGRWLLANTESGKLLVVDFRSGALTKTFDTPDVPVLPTPGEFALAPDGMHAYVSCPQGGTIEILNLKDWKLEEPIRLTKGVDGMAWVPSTTNSVASGTP